MDEQKKGTRRRGEALDEAILEAARDELSEVGYNKLTMESVAARAGTNKAVLYRRWANKSELVITAMHKYLPKITGEVPNTGDLRSDLLAYLLELIKPVKQIGIQTIREIMTEQLEQSGKNLINSLPQSIRPRGEDKISIGIKAILKNAELRGEINVDKLSTRIISLPLNLLQCEFITAKESTSDEVITEIIDDIFLPLVRAKAGVSK